MYDHDGVVPMEVDQIQGESQKGAKAKRVPAKSAGKPIRVSAGSEARNQPKQKEKAMLAREKARTASLPKRSAKSMGSRTIPQINATKGSKTRTMGQERAQPVPGPVEAWLLCHVRKLTHPPRLNSELPPLECVA